MKDLIQQATTFAESGESFTGAEVRLWVGKLTDALARATAVSLQPAHDQVTIECLNDKVMYLMGQIERLTAGNVALPEPVAHMFPHDLEDFKEFEPFADAYAKPISREDTSTVPLHTQSQLIDYGNRKDAAGYLRGVLAERERCALVCLASWGIDGSFTAEEFAAAIRKGTP